MKEINQSNMAQWVTDFDMSTLIEAVPLVREMSQWWRNHEKAAQILKHALNKYNVIYSGNPDHTYMCTALAILSKHDRRVTVNPFSSASTSL